uniref:GRIP domain-containing protein n=1 Tax=Parastrongyloides trichosuri TaxID=131310 RepID=A0A0N4ZG33_PARTI
MTSWLKNIQGQIQDFAQDVLNEAVEDNVDADAEVAVLKQKLADAEIKLSSEQVKIAQLEARLIGLSDQANASEDSSENIKAKYKSILSLKEKEIVNLRNENDRLKEELLVMDPNIVEGRNKDEVEDGSVVQDLRKKLQKCKKELVEAKRALNERDNKDNMISKKELEEKIRELKDIHGREIAALMANHEENMDNLKNEYEELLNNQENINMYKEKINELEGKIENLEKEPFRVGDVNDQREEIQRLNEDNSNLREEISSLRIELEDRDKAIQELIDDNEVQQTALEAMKKHVENINKESLNKNKEIVETFEKNLLDKVHENEKLLIEMERAIMDKNLIEEQMEEIKKMHIDELEEMNKNIQDIMLRLEESEKMVRDAKMNYEVNKEMIEKNEYDSLLERYNNVLETLEEAHRVEEEEHVRRDELHSRCDKLNANLLLFQSNAQKQEDENKLLLGKLNELNREFDILRNGLERTKEIHRIDNLKWIEEKEELLNKLEELTTYNLNSNEKEIEVLREKLRLAQEEVENLKCIRLSPTHHSDGDSNNGWRRLGDDHHEIMSVKTGSEVESTGVNDNDTLIGGLNLEIQELKGINSDMQLKIDDLEKIIKEKEEELNKIDKSHGDEIQEINEELMKWKELAEALRVKYEESHKQEEYLTKKLNNLENESYGKANDELTMTISEIEDIRKQLTKLEEEKMKISDNESELKQEVELLKEELEEMRRKNQCNQEDFKNEKEIIEKNLNDSVTKIIELEQFLATKHAESQGYYNKIQELVHEIAVREELLKTKDSTYQNLHAQMCYLEEEKCKYQSELGRLKEHLLVIEEQTTADQIAAEDRETELRKKIQQLERIKMENKDSVVEIQDELNRKVNDLTTEIEMLKEHKSILEAELMAANGELKGANLNLVTLQNALQDLTADQEIDIKKYKDQISSFENEIKKLHLSIEDMNRIKQASDREKIELNEIIINLKKRLEERNQDINDLEMQLQDIHNEREKLSTMSHVSGHSSHADLSNFGVPSTYKIDDSTLRQLFLSYFLADDDKKPEIAILLSSILNYSAEDREKINNHAMVLSNQKRGWIASILLSPNSQSSGTSHHNTSLTEQFVRFLENESKVKKNSIAVSEMSNESKMAQLDMGITTPTTPLQNYPSTSPLTEVLKEKESNC